MSPRDEDLERAAIAGRDPSAVERYGIRSAAAMLGGVFARASAAKPRRGVPCGHFAIDTLLGGFRPEMVTVLGASTTWGKSSFGVMTVDVGLRRGARILLVSGEDSEGTYGNRLMCRRANVNAMRLRDGCCNPEELRDMAAVVQEAEQEPVFFDGRGKTAEYLAAAISAISQDEGVDLVIVDYVQAFGCSKRTQDRRNEVTFIFRTFADAIKTSGASGLIMSQLRRLDPGEVPDLACLKESGDIENGAEHVLLGYNVLPKDGGPERKYMLVAKNKDGPRLAGEPIEMPFNQVTASFIEQRPDRQETRYADG